MNNKPNKKPQFNIKRYMKKFDSFEQMIYAFKTLHPEMKNIFNYEQVAVNPTEACSDILSYVNENLPNIIEKNNIPVALTMSVNKLSLKTAKFFTLGWNFNFDKNGFITDLEANISVFLRPDVERPNKYLKELADKLESGVEDGWLPCVDNK